ncbi:haloacid dehalogenase type II [Halalkalibacillus halophilus]|uniref:haloacid dehalogenase type II n=1 Tax=Halalkalibacillus halophilus TaxID=392827 RepID=UPI00040B9693|nr:haloacid dehalogenase type II [Halalkalibacillus halophilus]
MKEKNPPFHLDSNIKTIVFDVYGTLFDVSSVKKACDQLFPLKGEEISHTWRKKQIEYMFLLQLIDRYESFDSVTRRALRHAVHASGEVLSTDQEDTLFAAYMKLEAFPESLEVLKMLQRKGYHIGVFSNGTNTMLGGLLQGTAFLDQLDFILSVDSKKQYKPTKAAYQIVETDTKTNPEDTLFVSSNGWDIVGANNYGFQTVWVNRAGQTKDELSLPPNYIMDDLSSLAGN